MQVKLLSHTPEPEKVVAAAARLCYSPRSAGEIMEDLSPQETQAFLNKLLDLGHSSPLEHASFTFAIDGVSRSLSHQLVRHRIGVSFSQKSQRYVKEKAFDYIIPPSIAQDPALKEEFEEIIRYLQGKYNHLLSQGVQAEDARAILPNACATNLVVTMNGRSLHHFFQLRCCLRAQEEIRRLAELMLAEVRQVAPILFARAGATCDTLGICFEGAMSCGKARQVLTRQEQREEA